MVNKKKILVKEMFSRLQDEMKSSLGIMKIDHAPTLGDYTELNWIELFRSYLPRRYMVDKAFIVDSLGNISDAIDIVVYDALYSPFLLNRNGIKFIPSESVYAVFEVKQDLSKKHIEYAGNKAKSVRDLIRTSVPINNAGTMVKAKEHFEILSGLLTTRSAWKERKNAITLAKKYVKKLSAKSQLNLSCCLNLGNISLDSQTNEVTISGEKEALISFFFEFLKRLQDVGTTPAMDVMKYLE